jgi:hypothetical protein
MIIDPLGLKVDILSGYVHVYKGLANLVDSLEAAWILAFSI